LLTTGNFKEVKKGRLDDYRIMKYQSNVVADEFKYGSDRNVVVALEHNVLMVNKKDLLKVSCFQGKKRKALPDFEFDTAYARVSIDAYEEAPLAEPHRKLSVLMAGGLVQNISSRSEKLANIYGLPNLIVDIMCTIPCKIASLDRFGPCGL
jgi:hypothetical protein